MGVMMSCQVCAYHTGREAYMTMSQHLCVRYHWSRKWHQAHISSNNLASGANGTPSPLEKRIRHAKLLIQ